MTKVIICEASYDDFDFAFEPFLEDVKQGYLGIGGNGDYNSHFSGLLEKVKKAVDTWGCYSFESVIDDLNFVPAANRVKLYKLFDRPTCNNRWSYYNDDKKSICEKFGFDPENTEIFKEECHNVPEYSYTAI